MSPSDHIGVRFLATFLANIARTALSFVAGVLIARALGAADYGHLNFLLGSFAAINLVLDMGSSPAFYTLISQKRRGTHFYALYLLWTIGVQFFGTIVVVGVLIPRSVLDRIWLGHDRSIVLVAFCATFLTSQIWTMVSQMGEALRRTIIVQSVAVVQALLHLLLIAGAVHLKLVSVPVVLWLLIAEYAVLAAALGPILYRQGVASDGEQTRGAIVREFGVYCRPLVLYGVVGFFYQFADRWLLQRFGGAREQGFFSVGQQFANLSLLATISVLNVLWKEIAEARERGNFAKANSFFVSIRHGLYFVAAWLSSMFIPYINYILSWTVGSDYRGAQLTTALLFLYPVHQTLGQIQGTYLLSTGNTRTHSSVGIVTMVLSLPVTYFVLAPRVGALPGLELGAAGLAAKMLLLQFFGVTLQSVVLVRLGTLSYDFGYQFVVLSGCLTTSFACRWFVETVFFRGSTNGIATAITGSALYVAITVLVLLRNPRIIGVPRLLTKKYLLGRTLDDQSTGPASYESRCQSW